MAARAARTLRTFFIIVTSKCFVISLSITNWPGKCNRLLEAFSKKVENLQISVHSADTYLTGSDRFPDSRSELHDQPACIVTKNTEKRAQQKRHAGTGSRSLCGGIIIAYIAMVGKTDAACQIAIIIRKGIRAGVGFLFKKKGSAPKNKIKSFCKYDWCLLAGRQVPSDFICISDGTAFSQKT